MSQIRLDELKKSLSLVRPPRWAEWKTKTKKYNL